jgi:hypothetical protein
MMTAKTILETGMMMRWLPGPGTSDDDPSGWVNIAARSHPC